MNITVNKILELNEWADAKVVAGQKGGNRSVTWCNVVDMEKPWKWINPGELIFLSGIGLTDKEGDLCHLLTKMHVLKAGALVVQIGYYIKEIPPRVLLMASEYEIPVISIPVESKIPALTYQICQMLFQKEEQLDTPQGLMKELMYLKYDETLDSKLKFYGYNPQGYYVALALESDQKVKAVELPELNAAILKLFSEYFEIKPHNFLYLQEDSVFLVLIPLHMVPDYKTKLIHALRQIMKKLQNQYNITFCVGVSDVFGKPAFIKNSCNKAKESLNMLHACKKTNDIRFFEDMGVYSLFFRVNQKEELDNILELTLGRLLKHDEEHQTDLVHILDTYLSEDCNILRTSELLFAHRNTIKYKIAKIQEILLCDLKDVNTCFNIRLAYKIKRFLEID
ncbi:purine catabolism regulatory protein [Anaerotignum neopropionicum]|uniref:Purine catabolism regulatory protein n=1 Tax=Anaerotignum neopropionicum TaxID=36847 RepID=A0A136WD50_9FIRM|nr:PucR family transcriptional regulator [Anaerotignum neopropionicum]KXL52416.1 purine catabolism regulatory protein [Anaerotignum neopropionicum]